MSCHHWSLHCFQTSYFICDQFACKLWLQSIQNHARYCLQAFACLPSEVAVLFDSNLSRHPFLGHVVDLDLLLCTGFHLEQVVLFLCHIFTQRPMTDRKNKHSNGHCFGFLANSIKIFISHEKKSDLLLPEISKALKSCWLLNWVSIAGLVACFPQESLSLPAATVADSETFRVCARLSYPRKQSWRAAPRAWQLILPSKPSITFWNSLQRDCQMTCRGSNLDSNLNFATWPTSCKGLTASEITK